MKNLFLFSFLLMFLFSAAAQDKKMNYPEEVKSIDKIVSSIYAIVSGKKGEERNWRMMRTVFHPKARLMTTFENESGEKEIRFFNVEDYITTFRDSFYAVDLYEKDVRNEVERFGNMAHVFSTYQAFSSEQMKEPARTGISSIQLFHDGKRWWVLSMYWTNGTDEMPVPPLYLPE